jgi:hypothetical protein
LSGVPPPVIRAKKALSLRRVTTIPALDNLTLRF